jgi:hypothetical protein
MRKAYNISVAKPERNIPSGGSSWKDNIKMHLREIGWKGVD